MREEILRHSKKFLEARLSTFESGEYAKTWFHGDIRQTGMDEIFIVGA